MLAIQLGIHFRISKPGFWDPNKAYPCVGATYEQGQLVLFFINEHKKMWFVNHELCECVDEQYYGQDPAVANLKSFAAAAAERNVTVTENNGAIIIGTEPSTTDNTSGPGPATPSETGKPAAKGKLSLKNSADAAATDF